MGGAGSIAPFLMNVLQPAGPILRIRARLGDLDLVFPAIGTVLGKKQRLQALGYYYETITGAAAGEAVTEAYTNCLAQYCTRRGIAVAAAEADLQAQIRSAIVQGAALPAAGSMAEVYLPGALTFNNDSDLGRGGAAAGASPPSLRYNDEGTLWTNNPSLGHIPIIATVEQQDPASGAWSPSPNRTVHFQLIAPFYDNPADEMSWVNGMRNQSEQGTAIASNIVPNAGPKPYLTTQMGASFDAADPQQHNCHTSRGGKRGMALMSNLFDSLPAAFPGMNAVSASGRPYAVKAQTNASGEAGVMFLPSRIGGDRYRFRIFVDPIGARASDGTGAGAVAFETGRLVNLKQVYWQRYLMKPLPAPNGVATPDGMQMRLWILGYDVGKVDGLFWDRSKRALRAFQRNHAGLPNAGADYGNPNHAATQVALDAAYLAYLATCGGTLGVMNFAWAYNQFDLMYGKLDNADAIAQALVPMTAADYQAAIRWARGQCHTNRAALGAGTFNVNVMFEDYFDTPYLFPIRHPAHYNRTRGAGFPAVAAGADGNFTSYWVAAANVIYNTGGLLTTFVRFITGGCSAATAPTANITRYSSPGLTHIAALANSQMMFPPNEPNQVQILTQPASPAGPFRNIVGASGWATPERGSTIYYGATLYVNWPYQGDGYSKNSFHEIGHTLYYRHRHSAIEDHDAADRCLMGYLYCEGEYCGQCQLKFRGWDISTF